MKKHIILLAVVVVFSVPASAQLEKGTVLIGGSGSFGGAFGSGGAQYSLQIQPSVGIFVLPKFAIGSGVDFFSQNLNFGSSKISTNGTYLAPFARYYFFKQESSFNLFAEVGVFIGGTWLNDGQSSYSRFSVIPNMKIGGAYFIRPQIAIEAAIVGRFDPNIPFFSSRSSHSYIGVSDAFG